MDDQQKTDKCGRRVEEWPHATGVSRVFELLSHSRISSVKFDGARIITTAPKDFHLGSGLIWCGAILRERSDRAKAVPREGYRGRRAPASANRKG